MCFNHHFYSIPQSLG
jgi:hypothetical protein